MNFRSGNDNVRFAKTLRIEQGDIFDNESLVEAIKQVDVVISTIGGHMIPYQHKILSAIKQAGNVKVTFISSLLFLHQTCSIFCHTTMALIIVTAICVLLMDWKILTIKVCMVQRFFPSEFGNDADHIHSVEPAKSMYAAKAEFRRAVEAEGIPHTFVVCNFFDGYFLSNLSQPDADVPPRDKVVILGDGNPKGINC